MAPKSLPAVARAALAKSAAKAEAKRFTSLALNAAIAAAKAATKGASYVLVIGVDPGPLSCGVGIVKCHLDGTLEYRDGVHQPNMSAVELVRAKQANAQCAKGVVVLATEIPQWTPRLPFAGALVETARVEGELAASFEAMQGRPPIRLRALDWKRIIGLRPNADDAMVKMALPRLVSGIPRTNCHVRDAIGVATAAAKLMGLGWKMVKP